MNKPRLPAAALQSSPSPELSERYGHVDTREIIMNMEYNGWMVHRADAAAARKGSSSYARHRVVFRRPGKEVAEGLVPEMVFINSHDGTSGARFHQGAYREASALGMIVGATRRVRHSIEAEGHLITHAMGLIEGFSSVTADIVAWQNKRLSPATQTELARLGGQLRYGDGWMYDDQLLLAARRPEDKGDSLWSTYVRLHENFIRGGFRGRAISGQAVTALPLSCIERDSKFNATLWQLAGEFL